MSDLEKAKLCLSSNGHTCVLCKDERIYTSSERGVKPLVTWYDSKDDFHGFSAADKVVGKGAAFLYVLLDVKAVFAHVISVPALSILKKYNICVEYDTKTDRIVNRKGDGICPFELAVMDVEDANNAYLIIRKKMQELNIPYSL